MSRRTPPENLLAALREKFDGCLTTHCRQGGCRLGLKGLPRDRVIVDGDKYKERLKFKDDLCDRILFWLEKFANVAVAELKGGTLGHMRDAQKQLQNGSNIAEGALAACPDVGFLAILLHGGRVDLIDYKVLQSRSSYLTFRNRSCPILLVRCGEEIGDIVARYGQCL